MPTSIHPERNHITYANDIAMIRVKIAFNFKKESVSSVRLPEWEEILPFVDEPKKQIKDNPSKPNTDIPKAGDHCSVAGWGSTRPFSSVSEISAPIFPSKTLQVAEVSIWKHKTCVDNYEIARKKSKELKDALKAKKVYLNHLCANNWHNQYGQLSKNACKVTTAK